MGGEESRGKEKKREKGGEGGGRSVGEEKAKLGEVVEEKGRRKEGEDGIR